MEHIVFKLIISFIKWFRVCLVSVQCLSSVCLVSVQCLYSVCLLSVYCLSTVCLLSVYCHFQLYQKMKDINSWTHHEWLRYIISEPNIKDGNYYVIVIPATNTLILKDGTDFLNVYFKQEVFDCSFTVHWNYSGDNGLYSFKVKDGGLAV